MTLKYYTEKVFERLGSVIKKYILIKEAAHFPTHKAYYSNGQMKLMYLLRR